LPDSTGIATFDRLHEARLEVPILILGGGIDEALAVRAVERGAQDYILPTHQDSYSLSRALRNAIERKSIEDALYLERERALVTLNSIGDGVLCTDIAGNVTYLNLVAEGMTGWRREDAVGKPLAEVFRIIDAATGQPSANPMDMAVAKNATVGLTMNCVLILRDGFECAIEDSAAPIHDRSGVVIGAVIVFHDVSLARAMSLQLSYSSQHDLVTNLPNRLLLNDRILQSISLARRQKRQMAVIFADLDHFKYINDSLGHHIGDKLLQSVAKRLVDTLRASDTVSRQGGDEFLVLLSDVGSPQNAAEAARKLIRSISAPHIIENHTLHINASLGISVFPQDGDNPETLIQNADVAMYHAKESGRNNFQFFTAEMNRRAVERQSLESSLRCALDREEFLLHYQPKVRLDTREITGIEALIRWRQPDRGFIPPSEFVPVAEECGLIVQIGQWVLREACRQACTWQEAGLPRVPISVNVSSIEFRNEDFISGIRTALSETGLAAKYLELELTEGVLMKNAVATASALVEIKGMGVRLALDDFGTGFSSLSYLRQFPIDVLKIDQSFVRDMTANPEDSAIAGAIIDLGRSLKRTVVAEGIETQQQMTCLQALHCKEGQGYLFSCPVPAAHLASLWETGIPLPV